MVFLSSRAASDLINLIRVFSISIDLFASVIFEKNIFLYDRAQFFYNLGEQTVLLRQFNSFEATVLTVLRKFFLGWLSDLEDWKKDA
jgi:hypothetical protein